MASLTAAGFATLGMKTLLSPGNTESRLQSGRAIHPTGIVQDNIIRSISHSVCETALTRHAVDFERVDRRTESLVLLKDTLADLKSRVDRKMSGRSRLIFDTPALELSYKAS